MYILCNFYIILINQELVAESQTCQSTVEQFLAAGRRIVENFEAKQVSCEFIQSELTGVQLKWEEYQSSLTSVHDQLQNESDELNQFLENLYGFCERLNDVYVEVVDECWCTTVPPRASREIVARHRQNLEVSSSALTFDLLVTVFFCSEIYVEISVFGVRIQSINGGS